MYTRGKYTSRVHVLFEEGKDTSPEITITDFNARERELARLVRAINSELNKHMLGIAKLSPEELKHRNDEKSILLQDIAKIREEGRKAREAQRGKILGGITSISRNIWNKAKDTARPMTLVTFNSEEKLKKADALMESVKKERQKKEEDLKQKQTQKAQLESELKKAQELLKQSEAGKSLQSPDDSVPTQAPPSETALSGNGEGNEKNLQSSGVVEVAKKLSVSRAKVVKIQQEVKQSQELKEKAKETTQQAQNKLFDFLSSLPDDQQTKIIEVLTHGLTPEEQSVLQGNDTPTSPEIYVKMYENFYQYIGESFFDALLKKDNTKNPIYIEIQKYLYPDRADTGELPEITKEDIIRLKDDKGAYQIFARNQDALKEYAISLGLSDGIFSTDVTQLSATISAWYSGSLRTIGSNISEIENTKSLVQAEEENEQNEEEFYGKVQEVSGKIEEIDYQIEDTQIEISTYTQLDNAVDQWHEVRSDTPITSERIGQLSIGEQTPMIISTQDGPVMYYIERKGPRSLQVIFSENCTLTLEGDNAEIQNKLNIIKDIRKIPVLSNMLTTPIFYQKVLKEFASKNSGKDPFADDGIGLKAFLVQLLVSFMPDAVGGKSEVIGPNNFQRYINRISANIDFRNILMENLLTNGVLDPMNGNIKDSIFTRHDQISNYVIIDWP